MPYGQAWTGPQPHLVSAAAALSAGRHESCAAALDAAEGILERLPADQEVAGRLAAAMIRLAASRRTGDLTAAAAAAARAEALASRIPGEKLARHPNPGPRAVRPRGRRAVVRPSGRGGPYPRVGGGRRGRAGGENERADCLGHLALAEALRGRLRRAAIAGRPGDRGPHGR